MFRNTKISTQLAFTLLLMILGLAIVIGTELFFASTSNNQIKKLHEIGVKHNTVLQTAFAKLLRTRLAWATSYAEAEAGEKARASVSFKIANQLYDEADEYMREFKNDSITDFKDIENEILSTYQEYKGMLDQQKVALKDDNFKEYLRILLVVREINDKFEQNINDYNKTIANYTDSIMQSAAARKNTVFNGAFVLSTALLVLIFLCWRMIKLQVLNPLKQLGEHFTQISDGDLRTDIQVHSTNEIGQLFKSLQSMQNKQRVAIGSILKCSNKLANAANELNNFTSTSNSSLQQQHQELELAASAVNEMTVAVEEVAHNAVTTSEASKVSNKLAQDSRSQIHATLSEVKQMSNEIQNSSEQVQDLAVRANNIGAVLDVIRTVSEQTNLLALNAAIEAARAGEAGRGFAVVADEVRTLARRTQDSTSEIEKIVTSIQNSTEQAVNAMMSSSSRAQTTLDTATTAGEALEQIFTAITQINERNLIIASAAEEQAQVAREVDRNLVNIRDLSSAATKGSKQSIIAIDELTKLADELNSYTKQFNLNRND